jgi:hypothetical protein
MDGTLRERHCERCDKLVYNFAAMTSREIEHLVREKDGHLCARVDRRADGSVVSLDGQSQPSMAAGMVLAASLAFGASAGAQSISEAGRSGKAQLTGTVLVADGSEPAVGTSVLLVSDKETVAQTTADAQGHFLLIADPGRYDIVIWQHVLFRSRIPGADLHAGEQSLQPIRVPRFEQPTEYMTTLGEIAVTYKYPISYLFKHPIRYLKHLPHNF